VKCWFFHKWTKWSEPTVIDAASEGATVAQSKVCEDCNMKKWRRVLVTN
jgi:hypothetical protein